MFLIPTSRFRTPHSNEVSNVKLLIQSSNAKFLVPCRLDAQFVLDSTLRCWFVFQTCSCFLPQFLIPDPKRGTSVNNDLHIMFMFVCICVVISARSNLHTSCTTAFRKCLFQFSEMLKKIFTCIWIALKI